MSLKVVSINIEGRKHLERVTRFLEKEDAQVACLMEVCQSDVLQIAGNNYPFVVFAKNDVLGNIAQTEDLTPTGVAILSKFVMIEVEKEYFGEQPRLKIVPPKSSTHAPVLLSAQIGEYRIGVVHFTWTKGGMVSEVQRTHMERLLNYLSKQGELVLCGDFNSPRGGEMYHKLVGRLTDNIPAEIETTIDPRLHYTNQEVRGKLQLVVDYVWSTSQYEVKNVRVESGVSDHCAIVCEVDKLI
jgi:endonuclease/exonuclease/phosphatase family metal-dependent hydrolase